MHSLTIDTIDDITLDLFAEVTRHRATVSLTPELSDRIDGRRAKFVEYVERHAGDHLYGITTRHHIGAKRLATAADLLEYSSRLPAVPATFADEWLPDRLTRGIVIARLADYINGTGAVRSDTVKRMLTLLETHKLPQVPARGNGDPGDIIALGYLFREVLDGTLQTGEGMAVINGSPVGSAALADGMLTASRLLAPAEVSFALAARAIAAPLQHFDEHLGQLWGDEFIAQSLTTIRHLLNDGEAVEHLAYQAPVSFRSAPRVTGWLRRTLSAGTELATAALRMSTNNPAFFSEDDIPPHGAILANGGYHSAYTSPALDGVTRSLADLTQILAGVSNHLAERLALLEPESAASTLYMTTTGWAEEARAAATASLTSLINGGQTDSATLDLLAWRKAQTASTALEATTTLVAVQAAHMIAREQIPVAGTLGAVHETVLSGLPIETKARQFPERLQTVRSALFSGAADAAVADVAGDSAARSTRELIGAPAGKNS